MYNDTQAGLGQVSEVDQIVRVGVALPQTGFARYTYDPTTGRETSIATDNGMINYAYDPATGLLIETWTGPAAGRATADNDIQYGYDSQGRLASVTQVRVNGQTPPAAFVEGVQYNAVGVGGIPLGPTTNYYYDQNGNLFEVDNPNGVITHYSYDYLNRMTEEDVENLNGNTPIMVFSEQVAMLNQGHKSEVIDTHYNADGSVFFQTQTNWSYDSLYRLTDEHMTVLQGSGTGVPVAYDDQFSYDGNNNRTQEIINGGAAIVNYTYNGDDQLLTETRTGAGAYNISYTYDANGNLSTKTQTGTGAQTDSYGYDLSNRMTTATVGGSVTTYTYDYIGVLVSESSSAGTTYYLNDPNNPTGYTKAIQETKAATGNGWTERSFVLGQTVIAQYDSTHGMLYLAIDSHGSTRVLLDNTGAVKQILDYDAFGGALDFNPATAQTVWLFGGDGLYDPSTGWTYHSARWRNGFMFTQSDPTSGSNSDPISLHKYLYANGDPVNMTDPSGFYSQSFGYAAHDAIENIYEHDHPGDIITRGKWTRFGIPDDDAFNLKPDILNKSTSRWAEIKPLGPSGAIKGAAQYGIYLASFVPFGYRPDVSWSPSTNSVIVQGHEVRFFNAGGIIFYTTPEDLEKYLAATVFVASIYALKDSVAVLAAEEYQSAIQVLNEILPGVIGAAGTDSAELNADLAIGFTLEAL